MQPAYRRLAAFAVTRREVDGALVAEPTAKPADEGESQPLVPPGDDRDLGHRAQRRPRLTVARPASSRATGTRNGEQDT